MDVVKPTKGLLLSFSNGKAEALFFWCDLLLQILAMFNRVGQTVPVYAEKRTAPNGRIQPTSDLENWKAPGKKRRKEKESSTGNRQKGMNFQMFLQEYLQKLFCRKNDGERNQRSSRSSWEFAGKRLKFLPSKHAVHPVSVVKALRSR